MSEAKARAIRWILIVGWIGLIFSLYIPLFGTFGQPSECKELNICGPSQGNFLFWNVILPYILICVVLSHELWRRICPLSFVSQIPRSLGIQRQIIGKNGKKTVASVKSDSWLGKHYFQLQWALLISGLSLRILLVNSNSFALAVLFTLAIISSIFFGWAYSGKAWCQYVCPFGAVQKVITGPRSLLDSNAHLDNPSKITQSMCRTISQKEGQQDISTCVACNKACIDIDSQRSYWDSLHGQRGVAWAWYSYPGLVIGFFLLTFTSAPPSLHEDYLKSHLYAYDQRLTSLILSPVLPEGFPVIPRLIGIPLLLVAFAVISKQVFTLIETLLRKKLTNDGISNPTDQAIHKTRLLATFTAINSYFLIKGSMWSFSARWDTFIDMMIMAFMSMWLVANWKKSFALYQRESTVTSLRKQLAKLNPEKIESLLCGRTLKELNPNEIFVLAKALPQQERGTKREIYINILKEQFEQGRLDRKTALIRLEELRLSLGLSEDDHYAAIDVVFNIDPRIKQLSPKDLAGRELRMTAAREELEELMSITKTKVIDIDNENLVMKRKIDQIQVDTGLDNDSWNTLLSDYTGDRGSSEEQVSNILNHIHELHLQICCLQRHSGHNAYLLPLITSLEKNIAKVMPSLVSKQLQLLETSGLSQPNAEDCSIYSQTLSSERIKYLQTSEGIPNPVVQQWAEAATYDANIEPLEIEETLHQILDDHWDPQQRSWISSTQDEQRKQYPMIETLANHENGRLLLSLLDLKCAISLPEIADIKTLAPNEELQSHDFTVSFILNGNLLQADHSSLSNESTEAEPNKPAFVAGPNGCLALIIHELQFMRFIDQLPLLKLTLARKYFKTHNFMSIIDLAQEPST